MLNNILSKPVELLIDDKLITFKSLDDFEYCMNARTAIPIEKINETINSAPDELVLEANVISVSIEQFTELNERTSRSGELTQQLKSINPISFTSDNGWRSIFFALKKDQSAESSKYKQIALDAYLKYLSNRLEMIQTIKDRLEKENIHDVNAESVNFRTGELEVDQEIEFKKLAKDLGLKTMPEAETVFLDIKEGEIVELLLANYKCKLLYDDNELLFVDHEENVTIIDTGLNKVGRSSECKVRFNDTTQRISRVHLLIINNGEGNLELNDLSTYGTFYNKKKLKKKSQD